MRSLKPRFEADQPVPLDKRLFQFGQYALVAGLTLMAWDGPVAKLLADPIPVDNRPISALNSKQRAASELKIELKAKQLSTTLSYRILQQAHVSGLGSAVTNDGVNYDVSIYSRDGTSGMTTNVQKNAQGAFVAESANHTYFFKNFQGTNPTADDSFYFCIDKAQTEGGPRWRIRTQDNSTPEQHYTASAPNPNHIPSLGNFNVSNFLAYGSGQLEHFFNIESKIINSQSVVATTSTP